MTNKAADQLKAALRRLTEAGVETPLLDAQLMMAKVLGCSRLDVIAHSERPLTDSELAAFSSLLDRRACRCPLAYILGVKEFYALEFNVSPSVLIPRPETEVLVESCLSSVGRQSALIAEVGAGSGAIAVALAANLPSARIYATEISPAALEVARDNVEKHQLAERVALFEGNFLEPLARLGLRFDAVVSNPPYIPSSEIATLEPEIKDHEPVEALDGGQDGLDAYRALFPAALELLREGGFAAVEVGKVRADAVRGLAIGAGYGSAEAVPDLAGILRVVIGYK